MRFGKNVAAIAAVLVVTGCGAKPTEPAVSSWQEWGKYAVEKLDSCDPSDTTTVWTCFRGVVDDLDAKTRALPYSDPVDRQIGYFDDAYGKLAKNNCLTSIMGLCMVYSRQADNSIDMLRSSADKLAAGQSLGTSQ